MATLNSELPGQKQFFFNYHHYTHTTILKCICEDNCNFKLLLHLWERSVQSSKERQLHIKYKTDVFFFGLCINVRKILDSS